MNKSILGIRNPRILYSTPIELEKKNLSERGRVVLLVKISADSGVSVSIGEKVKTGRKIGYTENRYIFSTITGEVKKISRIEWLNGINYHAVQIERTGDDEWETVFVPSDENPAKSREEILTLLESAGYPVNYFKSERFDRFIINCTEEDVLTSNIQATILEKKDLFTEAVNLAGKLANSEVIVVVQTGFENKIREIYKGEIRSIKPVYPSGMNEILPRALNLEGNIGIIRADLLINMLQTLKTGLPVFERIVTLIGEGNKPLKNILVRIGAPVSEILNKENFEVDSGYKIILGGAMRGRTVFDGDFPVQKNASGIMVQGKKDVVDLTPQPCLNCGECVKVCPQNLQVNMLTRYSEFSIFDRCKELNIADCIECGMCAYVCTSHKPIVQYLQFAKKQLSIIEASKKEISNDK
ncbi:MAG: 4Fe-4S dicluster domain-containing protein [Spirochaetes bacterium]|nr:4Fe-4S dicluster domain-containing protein [Spirochaetota bacterium]